MKKQGRSIRSKILLPLLAIVIGMPVVIVVAFHMFISTYIDAKAGKELENVVQTTTALIKNQVIQNSGQEGNREAGNLLRQLKAVLTAARMTGNTSFYLFDQQMRVLYPTERRAGADASFIQLLEPKMQDVLSGATVRLKGEDGTFYVAGEQMEWLGGGLVLNVIMVNEQNEFFDFVAQMDVVFCLTALAAILVAAVLTLFVAQNISRATKKMCENAKKIGDGSFIQLEIDRKTVREIADLYQSLNEMSGRLKQYDETQKSFLQNVSHELRTPLMSIQGYAEGIEYHVFDDVEHAAQVIGDESRRMTSLVEELLTLSRLENETIHVNMQCHACNLLLSQFVDRMKGLTLLRPVEIHFSPGEEAFIYVDEVMLSNAVTNIVGNGVRHAGSRVEILTERMEYVFDGPPKGSFLAETVPFAGDSLLRIRIWDDGEGFAKEDLPYIFERFYKGKGGKFGIGLSIAKSSVEKMGGQILAYNGAEEGVGACFEIRLPIYVRPD